MASATGGNASLVVLLLAVFGASAVEMVEALTIVIAVGTSRGWRTALRGGATAIAVLALIVGIGGVPLVRYTPIDPLRVVVGSLLLLLGIAWLHKAILRSAGIVAQHDEDRIYAETVEALSHEGGDVGSGKNEGDTQGFIVAFKGVFLEGIEVVVIVISLGASQHRLGPAAAAAGAAALIVAGIGAILARQLSEVPENWLKTIVGVMLTSFGTFWLGEGARFHWPGSDLSLPVLVGVFGLLTGLLIMWMRRLCESRDVADTRERVLSGVTTPRLEER